MAVRAPHGSAFTYDKMKARHKEAYGYLSRALQIDESGIGEMASGEDGQLAKRD